MWDFTHQPRQAALRQRYEVHFTLPNLCAEELATGASDIGLVPVAACATNPSLTILPGIAIASLGSVRSILLITRPGLALKDVQSVALDTTSRTSAALVRVLFSKFVGTIPRYTQHAPALEDMLAGSDAALLIGDPALLARAANACETYPCYDLAEYWKQQTGLPFVFAVWAMRPDALTDTGTSMDEVVRDFQASRDAGLHNLDALVEEWAPRIALPAHVIREYWTRNIHYSLDAECLQGLRLFYQYAAECGALPAVEEFPLWEG
jgi:chorismate dehydratase